MKKIIGSIFLVFCSLILANFCYAQEATTEQGTSVNDTEKQELLLKERNDTVIDYDNVGTSSIVYFFDGTPTDEQVVFNGNSNYSNTVQIATGTQKIYQGLAYHKVDDIVYKIESDTVDKEIFDKTFEPKTSFLFVKTVYGDTIYSGGDGGCYKQSITSFSTAREAEEATACDRITADTFAGSWYNAFNYIVSRGFLNFDTTSLPNNAEISSSTLMVYISLQTDEKNDAYSYIGLYVNGQSNPISPPMVWDYNTCGTLDSPELISATRDITGLTVNKYHYFALNSVGYLHINPTGYTQICAREGHDVENQNIGTSNDSKVSIRFSAYAGTGSDPYLLIAYTVPETGGGELTGIGTSTEVYGLDIGQIYLNATSTVISTTTKITQGKISISYLLFSYIKKIIFITMLVILLCLYALIYKKL